jgi:hypothetical protein
MFWDELNRRVKEKQPTSAQHMWELLQDCWKSIPREAFSLVERMPRVCKAVIKAKGGYLKNFKYILICLRLFVLLHDSVSFHSFDVFTLFYNVENSKK